MDKIFLFSIFFHLSIKQLFCEDVQCKEKFKKKFLATKSWKNRAKKLLIIQNWTFFHVLAWLPKRPILCRNWNLKGSPCPLSIYSLVEGISTTYILWGPFIHCQQVVICFAFSLLPVRFLKRKKYQENMWELKQVHMGIDVNKYF